MEALRHRNKTLTQLVTLALLLVSISLPLGAYNNLNLIRGTVGAVGVVLDDDGDPILAEYSASGNYVRDVNVPGGTETNDLIIYSGEAYRSLYTAAQDLLQAYPGARIMSKEQYNSQSFRTHTQTPQAISKPRLIDPDTQSVLVIDERQMLVPSPPYEGFILHEFPVDLSPGVGQALPDNIVSVLINKQGAIVFRSSNDIAYKIDIFERDGDTKILDEDGFFIPTFPLEMVAVTAGDVDFMPMGGAVTDEKGRYAMPYTIPPCPGFFYQLKVPIIAHTPLTNFNPKSDGSTSYNPALFWDWATCVGYDDLPLGGGLMGLSTQMALQGIVASMATPIHNLNLNFSTMQLAAIGTLGQVELSDTTEYQSDDSPIDPLAVGKYNFDFDGDGSIDTIKVNAQDNTKLDIYLGDNNPDAQDAVPDLTRLADYDLLKQLNDQGLLKTISKADLEDTDIYIYRNSTNQLIGQMEGLVERDHREEDDILLAGSNNNSPMLYKGVHEDETFATFGFSSLLLGASSFDLISGLEATDSSNRRPWISPQAGSATSFDNDRQPDFMRPGEIVKIVAINRATGYMGSADARLQANYIQLETPIALGPPNLKVIATRTYKDQAGLTKDEQHDNQLIGSEGAGLTSDQYIKIQTIWLDHKGNPLPENLPGYTGRVAISTGSATEDFSGNFQIKPGYQTELIQLNNAADLTTQHFYVQVIGENYDGNPSFESPGAGPGKLQTRPKKYTPIKVPVYNELATQEAQQALIKATQEGVTGLPDEVQPVYHWVYRPEMQFSVYGFMTQQLQLTHADGTEHLIDLTQDTNDLDVLSLLLADDIDATELLYDLLDPDNDALAGFGPDRQLILSIGAEEVLADITPGGSVLFNNPQHIDLLSSEDLISISLYQNNDSFNVLWKYSLYAIGGKVDNNRDGVLNFDPPTQSEQANGEPTPGDDATKVKPLRFWVNNDYDVVNDTGMVSDAKQCPPTIGNQVCEQWDETETTETNTDDQHIEIIESERDLEDFLPLIIQLPLPTDDRGYPDLPEGASFIFRAKNININLFRGAWKKGTDYLTDKTIRENQVKRVYDVDGNGTAESMYLFKVGSDHPEELLNQSKLNDVFGKSTTAKFIFESYAESPDLCAETPEECYLELAIVKGNEVLGTHKLYMQFYDVKHFYDHYSVATGLPYYLWETARSLHLGTYDFININEHMDEGFENEYIMMVHGWRMQENERVSFGETAFKRLYWSGYKGRFGLYSWPTGWFEKPAYVYGAEQLNYLEGNMQNYGDSEIAARASGAKLSNLLVNLGSQKNIHIFAHSMGNVVVSEALRTAGSQQIVKQYIASQAAEVASAYNPSSNWMDYLSFSPTPVGVEQAWRLSNADFGGLKDTEFDMPPNQYTFVVPELHGATVPKYEQLVSARESWGPNYYATINQAAGAIINFHNRDDAALESWKVNQMTKPDYADGPTWDYDWNWDCPYSTAECLADVHPDVEDDERVTDHYSKDGNILSWTRSVPISVQGAQILGHIIPSRSGPLGHAAEMGVGSVITDQQPFAYGDSNQGHSAQFFDSYGNRKTYWDRILFKFRLTEGGA